MAFASLPIRHIRLLSEQITYYPATDQYGFQVPEVGNGSVLVDATAYDSALAEARRLSPASPSVSNPTEEAA